MDDERILADFFNDGLHEHVRAMSSPACRPRYYSPCSPQTDWMPTIDVAAWALALLDALAVVYNPATPSKAINYPFADLLVLEIKLACRMLGGEVERYYRSWCHRFSFDTLYKEFGKVGYVDVSAYVHAKTGTETPMTPNRYSRHCCFTQSEQDVLKKLETGQFSARWLVLKERLDMLRTPILAASLPDDGRHCAICQEELDVEAVDKCSDHQPERAVRLPCGHIFGDQCILNWFLAADDAENEVTCPTCRYVVFDEEFMALLDDKPELDEAYTTMCEKARAMLLSARQRRPDTVAPATTTGNASSLYGWADSFIRCVVPVSR